MSEEKKDIEEQKEQPEEKAPVAPKEGKRYDGGPIPVTKK